MGNQRSPQNVVPTANFAVLSLVHEGEVILHVLGREHVDVLDPKWLENVLLEVVIQRHSGDSFDDIPSPINADLNNQSASVTSRGDECIRRIPTAFLVRIPTVVLERPGQNRRVRHIRRVGPISEALH